MYCIMCISRVGVALLFFFGGSRGEGCVFTKLKINLHHTRFTNRGCFTAWYSWGSRSGGCMLAILKINLEWPYSFSDTLRVNCVWSNHRETFGRDYPCAVVSLSYLNRKVDVIQPFFCLSFLRSHCDTLQKMGILSSPRGWVVLLPPFEWGPGCIIVIDNDVLGSFTFYSEPVK